MAADTAIFRPHSPVPTNGNGSRIGWRDVAQVFVVALLTLIGWTWQTQSSELRDMRTQAEARNVRIGQLETEVANQNREIGELKGQLNVGLQNQIQRIENKLDEALRPSLSGRRFDK